MPRLHLPTLDRTAATPLAEQLATFYRSAIAEGHLLPGDRLPPIREIAEATGTTRTTVQDAYKQLADLGLVTGEVGRGTTVLAREGGPSRYRFFNR